MLTFMTLLLLGVASARSTDLASDRSAETFDMAIIDIEPDHAVTEMEPDHAVTEMPEESDVDHLDADHAPECGWGKKVAFFSYLGSDLTHLGTRQHIKFNQVLLNDGSAYTASTGVFRAPYSGVYQFTVSVGQRGAREITVRLVQDGRTIITAVAEGTRCYHDSQGSNTAIIRVSKGSHLWVETMYGNQIRGATHGTHKYHDTQGSNTAIIHVCKGKHLWVEVMHGDQIQGATSGDRPTTFTGFLLYARR